MLDVPGIPDDKTVLDLARALVEHADNQGAPAEFQDYIKDPSLYVRDKIVVGLADGQADRYDKAVETVKGREDRQTTLAGAAVQAADFLDRAKTVHVDVVPSVSETEEREMHNNRIKLVRLWELTGRKSFFPTEEMCASFAQVDINVPCADYAQPYDTVRVTFPSSVAARFKCHHAWIYYGGWKYGKVSEKSLIFASQVGAHWLMFAEDMTTTPDRFVEDRLFEHRPSERLAALADAPRQLVRIVINSCLALTHYAVRLAQAEAPASWPRKKKREWVVEQPQTIEFIDQTIRWFDRDTTSSQLGEGVGGGHASPKPHWRRGHWRRQAFGAGRTERKLVYIKPILVNAASYTGDHSQDFTEYTA